jgi:hypothetical protein
VAGGHKEKKPVGDEMKFHRRYWLVQRAGWALIGLVLLAAFLGLFGPGLLGKAHAVDQNSRLRVEYERFERKQAETTLRIGLGAGAAQDGEARLWLSREYLDGIEIQSVTPEPERVEAAGDRVTYVFRVTDAAQETPVTFHFEPERMGRLRGRAGLADGTSVDFSQFVYP